MINELSESAPFFHFFGSSHERSPQSIKGLQRSTWNPSRRSSSSYRSLHNTMNHTIVLIHSLTESESRIFSYYVLNLIREGGQYANTKTSYRRSLSGRCGPRTHIQRLIPRMGVSPRPYDDDLGTADASRRFGSVRDDSRPLHAQFRC